MGDLGFNFLREHIVLSSYDMHAGSWPRHETRSPGAWGLPPLQEVADVDLKYALTSAAAELSNGVAGLAVDGAAVRRPRRTSAYAAFKKVLCRLLEGAVWPPCRSGQLGGPPHGSCLPQCPPLRPRIRGDALQAAHSCQATCSPVLRFLHPQKLAKTLIKFPAQHKTPK